MISYRIGGILGENIPFEDFISEDPRFENVTIVVRSREELEEFIEKKDKKDTRGYLMDHPDASYFYNSQDDGFVDVVTTLKLTEENAKKLLSFLNLCMPDDINIIEMKESISI